MVSALDPAGGAYSAPPDPLWILGALRLREGEGEGGKKGDGEGIGKEGKGREGIPRVGWHPMFQILKNIVNI